MTFAASLNPFLYLLNNIGDLDCIHTNAQHFEKTLCSAGGHTVWIWDSCSMPITYWFINWYEHLLLCNGTRFKDASVRQVEDVVPMAHIIEDFSQLFPEIVVLDLPGMTVQVPESPVSEY